MNNDAKPGFGQRLLLALLKTLLTALILSALAVGGYFAVKELQRVEADLGKIKVPKNFPMRT